MIDLTFEPETHTYTVNGVIVPSVTQVIKDAGIIDTQWFTEWAAERGSRVHKAIEFDLLGELDEESVDEHVRPYLGAFRKFRAENDLKIRRVECHVYSPHGFTGTLDLFADLNGTPTILDWKTGKADRYVGLQLSGYSVGLHATHSEVACQLAAVELKHDGRYKFVKFPFEPKVFLAALEIKKWMRQK